MSLVFERPVAGPATHAFVLGVPTYPAAKPGQGHEPLLRGIRDVPSAADSARLFCDWLTSHADELAAPLASIEALIGVAAHQGGAQPHPWTPGFETDSPTSENVLQAGKDWKARVSAKPGDTALFFGCGHGLRSGERASPLPAGHQQRRH